MATSHTAGLHKIQAAEKKAAKIIVEARQRKTKRLREAKDEASKLVNMLSKEREQQFVDFQEKHLATNNDMIRKIGEETSFKLNQMEIDFNERKGKVIDHLLNIVVNEINPKFHRNLRFD